jgi:hypothetical protein
LNAIVSLWVAIFGLLLLAWMLDQLFDLSWGFSSQSGWAFLAAVGFAGFVWVFSTLILKIVLSYGRRAYGPEPSDEKLED